MFYSDQNEESRFKITDILKRHLSHFRNVHPWGVEPQSMEPESIILSIELWVQVSFFYNLKQKYNYSAFTPNIPLKKLSHHTPFPY